MLTGSCLCGAVRFELDATPTSPTACHCTQCRKQTGHYFASADVPKSAVRMTGTGEVAWYRSSPKVRRGFCPACGSTLFWEPVERDFTSVALGSIDGATGLALERHIFVAHKGDYYALGDGVPQRPE